MKEEVEGKKKLRKRECRVQYKGVVGVHPVKFSYSKKDVMICEKTDVGLACWISRSSFPHLHLSPPNSCSSWFCVISFS